MTSIATALALAAGRSWGAALVALAVLAGQLSVGWSNDYIDRDRDMSAQRADKPIVRGAIEANTVRAGSYLAFLCCVPLSLLNGWRAGAVHVAAVISAWAYNLGIKATLWSPLPYVIAFSLLPAFVTLGLDEPHWPPWWALAAGGAFGAGAHLINVVPDVDADRRAGVRGLPQCIGIRASLFAGAGLLLTASILIALPTARPIALALAGTNAVVAGAIVAVGVSGRPRAAFPLAMVSALLSIGLLISSGNRL